MHSSLSTHTNAAAHARGAREEELGGLTSCWTAHKTLSFEVRLCLAVRHDLELKLEAVVGPGHFVKLTGCQIHNEAPIFVEAYKMAGIDR